MITPQEANRIADEVVAEYAMECEVATPADISNALEMLISKAARGIEKYCGTDAAVEVITRTMLHVANNPAQPMVKQ